MLSVKSEEGEKFQNAFWYWNNFSYYVICIVCMMAALTLLTLIGKDSKLFCTSLGMLSSGIEVSALIKKLTNWYRLSWACHSSGSTGLAGILSDYPRR